MEYIVNLKIPSYLYLGRSLFFWTFVILYLMATLLNWRHTASEEPTWQYCRKGSQILQLKVLSQHPHYLQHLSDALMLTPGWNGNCSWRGGDSSHVISVTIILFLIIIVQNSSSWPRWFCFLGDIWHCLEILLVTIQERLLLPVVGKGQICY